MRRSPDDREVLTASVITSRGCPYKCYYCVSGNMQYQKFRKRTNENILDELVSLIDAGVSDIVFYDDCFFYNIKQVNEDVEKFCTSLIDRGIGLTWQMEIRADILSRLNERSISLLSQSGCRQINIGIEKTTSEGLRYLGKNIKLDDMIEGIDRIKGISSIKVAGTFILGGGRERESDVMKMIEASRNMN